MAFHTHVICCLFIFGCELRIVCANELGFMVRVSRASLTLTSIIG